MLTPILKPCSSALSHMCMRASPPHARPVPPMLGSHACMHECLSHVPACVHAPLTCAYARVPLSCACTPACMHVCLSHAPARMPLMRLHACVHARVSHAPAGMRACTCFSHAPAGMLHARASLMRRHVCPICASPGSHLSKPSSHPAAYPPTTSILNLQPSRDGPVVGASPLFLLLAIQPAEASGY